MAFWPAPCICERAWLYAVWFCAHACKAWLAVEPYAPIDAEPRFPRAVCRAASAIAPDEYRLLASFAMAFWRLPSAAAYAP